MARPRIARNAEQAAKIPIEQPIQIEIPPEGEVIIPPEQKADGGTVPDQKQAPQQPVAKPLDTKQDDSEVTSLKSQLEQLKRTAEDNARRAQEAATREQELRKQYEDQGRNFQTVVAQRGKAELDAISNGIAAAQTEAESAAQEIALYGEAQDWGGLAKAQAKAARAQVRLTQLEDAKVNFEARMEEIKRIQAQPQQYGDPVENHIANMQGVNEAQKAWLRAHPDALSDPEKNSYLRAAHYETQRKNMVAGSDAYFQYLEERLGYRQPVAQQEQEEEELPPQIVAAPPSREAPSATGRPATPTRITLTAEERQIAAASGISEIDYARNKLKLMEMKRQGQYRDGG